MLVRQAELQYGKKTKTKKLKTKSKMHDFS